MSNDAALVAGQIQDLASSVENVAEAVRQTPPAQVNVNVPEAAPPVVNVNVPEAAPPVVNVNVPEAAPPVVNVNVPEQLAPVVNVAAANPTVHVAPPELVVMPSQPSSYEVEITERDDQGYIRRFTINPR